MLERIIRVFKLDRQVFADIEHDEAATTQAAIVVAIVAGLAVIGNIISLLLSFLNPQGTRAGSILLSIVVTILLTFVNWVIWAGVTYLVGTRLFKGQATFIEMLREIGFATAPRMLGIIPCIGGIIGAIWSLIASYFAIKEGLDLDDTNTIITIVIGWIITVIIGVVIGTITGVGAAGLGAVGELLGS